MLSALTIMNTAGETVQLTPAQAAWLQNTKEISDTFYLDTDKKALEQLRTFLNSIVLMAGQKKSPDDIQRFVQNKLTIDTRRDVLTALQMLRCLQTGGFLFERSAYFAILHTLAKLLEQDKSITDERLVYLLNTKYQITDDAWIKTITHVFMMERHSVKRYLEKNLISITSNELDLSNQNIWNLAGLETIFQPQRFHAINLEENHIILATIEGYTPPQKPFARFKNVKKLSLSFNPLQELPADLFSDLTLLEDLYLQVNKLAFLPENIFWHNKHLLLVFLEANELTKLSPYTFTHCTQLEFVNLFQNNITELSSALFVTLTNLKKLYLQSNKLTDLPIDLLKNNVALEELQLSENPITYIEPAFWNYCTQLKKLYLYDCPLQSIPGIFNLRNLEEVVIDYQKFDRERKKQLLFFYACQTFLSKQGMIPSFNPSLYNSRDTESMELMSDQLNIGHKENIMSIALHIALHGMPKATMKHYLNDAPIFELNLSKLTLKSLWGIEFIDRELLTFICSLDLSHNSITFDREIDEYAPQNPFKYCSNLRYLNLSHNELNFIPATILKPLTELYSLQLNNNHFTKIICKTFATNMYALKILNLAHNEIEELSETCLSTLPNLEYLDLSANKFHVFHRNFFEKFKYLKEINVRENYFQIAESTFREYYCESCSENIIIHYGNQKTIERAKRKRSLFSEESFEEEPPHKRHKPNNNN